MSYPGSKGQSGVWQRIIGQMRPHSVYVEGFFGEGKVFWEKRRADSSILIDCNPRMISAAVTKLGDSAGVRAIVGNALKMLPDLFSWLPADSVVYLDPPYMLASRTKQLLYQFHGASDELTDNDHELLLAVSRTAGCDMLISHYPCEFYSSRLQGWRCIEYDTMTRGGKRRECLWCNFPEPTELHDWRFAGFNKRERFLLRRFVDRWCERLDRMPARKSNYIRATLRERLGSIVRPQQRLPHMEDLAKPPLVTTAARPYVHPKNRSQRI